jgi:hypothetical protein
MERITREMVSPVNLQFARDPEFEALQLWLDAETWLEPPHEVGACEVEAFAGVLGDSLSEDDEILAALLALAHSSLPRAGEVLQGYAALPHHGFGHLAQLAWEEWQFWAQRGPIACVA